jgi:hypothetical protein
MQLVMMEAADGDGVLVADLPPKRAGLGKANVMRLGRSAAADDARLCGHEFAMLLVAETNGLGRRPAATGVNFPGRARRFPWRVREDFRTVWACRALVNLRTRR